ncbi:MAG TPA: imidazoleglycerol-phosphate dehydratase HisB [Longimicrobiales bacterium]|nr:imidazoleglycerol-phosphate dehydratase HisB [Trueperaceae bacterium]HKJ92538.1 imidazoleglycerol-phosphate dehydratase HisB [Longimicrobiales bacterium]
MARQASVERVTGETTVTVALDLDAPAGGRAETGLGFLDHMLDQLIRHGRLALDVEARGDLHVDIHHLVEDCGITLGEALTRALGERVGIERYADAFVPMDETLAHVVLDLSGRSLLVFDPAGFVGDAGGFTAYHLREFLRAFANHAGATLHVRVLAGEETHHVVEAIMKAFARALYAATRITHDALPSTKGVL